MDVGIVTIDSELYETIISYHTNQTYELLRVADKEKLRNLDGVIIVIEKEDQLAEVIDWILICQKSPNMFIWIYSLKKLDIAEDVFRKLGVNELFVGEDSLPRLFLSIENIFN